MLSLKFVPFKFVILELAMFVCIVGIICTHTAVFSPFTPFPIPVYSCSINPYFHPSCYNISNHSFNKTKVPTWLFLFLQRSCCYKFNCKSE